jgi:flagellar hook-length control protein FliK
VASQLATVLVPAAHQPDGSYQVTIHLQPEDLGAVHVELHLEGSTINVSLHADGDATRDMLRQNLDQLRQQLESGGLSTGRFDVGSGPASDGEGGATGQDQASASPAAPGYEDQAGEATTGGDGRPLVPTSTNAFLDMRL